MHLFRRTPLAAALAVLCTAGTIAGCGGKSDTTSTGASAGGPATTGATASGAATTATSTTGTSPTGSAKAGAAAAADLTPAAGARVPASPQPGLARGLEVGISDQVAGTFAAPAFRALGIKKARLIMPYDSTSSPGELSVSDLWVADALKGGLQPLIALGSSRTPGKTKHLPSVAEYRRSFVAVHRRYPQVRLFTPWNEPNNKGEPTAKHPARAAAYADVVAKACPSCTVVAGDVQDQAGAERYIRRYRAALKSSPHVWGIHNYSDVNRFRTTGLTSLMKLLPGDIWLTETGGVARFGGSFPLNFQRQARALNYLFVTARAFPRVKRVYIYNWTGAAASAGFDAGLTNADGTPRPAYNVVKAALGH